jgi:hypothetical protein
LEAPEYDVTEMSEQQLCAELQRNCELRNGEEIGAFTAAARALPRGDDPRVLTRMLRCLRDVEAGEVQYELVEACERFSDRTFVPVVLTEAAAMSARSKRWFELVLQSLLNTASCIEEAKRVVAGVPPAKRRRFWGSCASWQIGCPSTAVC